MRDKRAVTAIEYALIASLVAVVIVAAVTTLGSGLTTAFTTITNRSLVSLTLTNIVMASAEIASALVLRLIASVSETR